MIIENQTKTAVEKKKKNKKKHDSSEVKIAWVLLISTQKVVKSSSRTCSSRFNYV